MKKILFASVFLAAFSCPLFAQTVEVTSTGLGLGTSTPGYLLDVEGGSAVLNGTHGSVYTSADQSPFLATGVLLQGKSGTPSVVAQTGTATSGSAFAVYNSTPAALLWVGGDGNVGVNTTSPTTKLAVSVAANSLQNLLSLENTDSSGAGAQFSFIHAGAVKGSLISRWDGAAWEMRLGGAADYGSYLSFFTNNGSLGERMRIAANGNVGVGVSNPSYKMEVDGSVRATSFVSNSTTYADFVFKPDYKLRPLADVAAAIQRDGHLPDIPSEAEVKAQGVDLARQQAKLLQKVEELTLYAIEQNKRIEAMSEKIVRLEHRQ